MKVTPPKTPPKTPLKEKLTNEALMNQCACQLKINRKGEAALIGLFSEIDERKLFAEEGYASMFKFCTGRLHLSEPQTYRRIGASLGDSELSCGLRDAF